MRHPRELRATAINPLSMKILHDFEAVGASGGIQRDAFTVL
jgi:hypothetical protein